MIRALRIIRPPAGSPPVPGSHAQPVGQTSVTSYTVQGGQGLVRYRITGLPLGQELTVQVVPGVPFIQATDTDAEFLLGRQTGGPAPFTLTPAARSQACDFNVITAPIPW